MKQLIPIVILALMPLAAGAQETAPVEQSPIIRPAGDAELGDFEWLFRPIVVFADSPADPRYGQQLEELRSNIEALTERDVIVLTDPDPALETALRRTLRPRGFQVVLIGKDGRVLQRRPMPWSVREITRAIDKLPSRQREIEERRGS